VLSAGHGDVAAVADLLGTATPASRWRMEVVSGPTASPW
jgi:hypothetical protein